MFEPSAKRKEEGVSSLEEEPCKEGIKLQPIKTVCLALGLSFLAILAVGFRTVILTSIVRFWSSCRDDFNQIIWNAIIDRIGEDPFTIHVYGTYILTNLVFWGFGSLYTYMDFKLAAREYKVQPGTNEPINKQKFWKMVRHVAFNQTVIAFPFNVFMFKFVEMRGIPDMRVLPSFHTALLQFAGFLIVEEIMFFYIHWLLHHRKIYKYIHKKHHEWTASVAFISLYCHPFEHLISNLVPVALGPILFGSHISVTWTWFCLAMLNTLNSHSGYHLPFLSSSEQHDFHHLKFNQCYGVLGILDYLHGTDVLFRSSVNYKRHITVMGLTPVRELYPDEKKED